VNLTVNARDAMPNGGKITITTSNHEQSGDDPQPRGLDIPPGSYACLELADTGEGMTAEVRDHVFEPFYSTKGVGRGTGLGLATVYGIVKQANGYLRVDSKPGSGAVFSLYLPATSDPVETAEEQDATPYPVVGASRETTVLVVEDEPALRRLVTRILRGAGYSVLEAEDGKAAVSIAGRHTEPIHLLLSDLVMPGLTGQETARQITDRRPEIRVLFMSGYSDDASLQRRSLSDEIELLEKPFSAQALLHEIERILETERGADDLVS
jgi:CheY-like chemotaxis protein